MRGGFVPLRKLLWTRGRVKGFDFKSRLAFAAKGFPARIPAYTLTPWRFRKLSQPTIAGNPLPPNANQSVQPEAFSAEAGAE